MHKEQYVGETLSPCPGWTGPAAISRASTRRSSHSLQTSSACRKKGSQLHPQNQHRDPRSALASFSLFSPSFPNLGSQGLGSTPGLPTEEPDASSWE